MSSTGNITGNFVTTVQPSASLLRNPAHLKICLRQRAGFPGVSAEKIRKAFPRTPPELLAQQKGNPTESAEINF